MAPMNIMHQDTIDETGQVVEKKRLTHNKSYEFGSGTSVNSRVRSDELLPVMHVWSLSKTPVKLGMRGKTEASEYCDLRKQG